ncbi:MAG: NUDIX domain-containing protein [Methylacidiphilales bacterium]|nr:NUDIX domain-containing protein [Candidatus Methylacidiphilales bacterium]
MKAIKGYRSNVGMIPIDTLTNKVLIGRRSNKNPYWQFPQGGIDSGESEQEAMYRELNEETGLTIEDVQLIAISRKTYTYKTPLRFRKFPKVVGQQQRWFLLKLNKLPPPGPVENNVEFVEWAYVQPEEAPKLVIPFKRKLYQQLLRDFNDLLLSKHS